MVTDYTKFAFFKRFRLGLQTHAHQAKKTVNPYCFPNLRISSLYISHVLPFSNLRQCGLDAIYCNLTFTASKSRSGDRSHSALTPSEGESPSSSLRAGRGCKPRPAKMPNIFACFVDKILFIGSMPTTVPDRTMRSNRPRSN